MYFHSIRGINDIRSSKDCQAIMLSGCDPRLTKSTPIRGDKWAKETRSSNEGNDVLPSTVSSTPANASQTQILLSRCRNACVYLLSAVLVDWLDDSLFLQLSQRLPR